MQLITNTLHVLSNISWGADIAGMLISVLLGVFWYSDAGLGKLWLKLTAIDKGKYNLKKKSAFLWHIPLSFLIAANITAFCKHFKYQSAMEGALIGYDLGLLVILFLAINYVYEQRSLMLYAINAGYIVVCTSLMGMAIGVIL